jgi:hypothetical protein
VHIYGFLRTLNLLKKLNEGKHAEVKTEILKMMIYWVTYVVSGLLIEWVPLAGLWSIRVIVLAAALNPKIDWKNLIYHRGFDGEYP